MKTALGTLVLMLWQAQSADQVHVAIVDGLRQVVYLQRVTIFLCAFNLLLLVYLGLKASKRGQTSSGS